MLTNPLLRLAVRRLLGYCSLMLFAPCAHGYIDVTKQMLLGNPSNATADPTNHTHYLIQRAVEALDYNDTLGLPNWASWNYTTNDSGSITRSSTFFTDTNLPAGFYRVTSSDYSNSGYDRGHMCPSADRTDTTNDNEMVFLMSNIIPQAADNNSGVWDNFETYCRSLAATNEMLIICGPRSFDGSRIQPSGTVAIPAFVWKVAVAVPAGTNDALSRITTSTRVIAIDTPNTNGVSSAWTNFITSAGQLELLTGLTFFTALPGPLASALRSKIDGQVLPPPAIVSFFPSAGPALTNVVITGTNFNSASGVAFNGVAATFSVNSNTQITATVPTNAISGLITVTTPSGSASSSNVFTITTTASSNVDLAISATHNSFWRQGDTGDTIILAVTNVGTVTSSGTVTVSNILPSGLVASAIIGAGWITNLSLLTCSRSDALNPGVGYPPIIVTVNVASNAPAAVTNAATISGGGDTNTSNNTVLDVISIAQTNNGTLAILLGWDTSGQTNYGFSPLAPSTNFPNLTFTGLTRGSGISLANSNNAAARAWGGVGFSNTTAAAAIGSNQFITFSLQANTGHVVSCSAISRLDYRRSNTGPTNGLLQYQIGTNGFVDVIGFSYPSNSSSGASIGTIDLSSIPALQNIPANTNVVFRIVNYNGGPSGTWYIYDAANSTAPDLALQGVVGLALTPIQAWRLQYFGATDNSGSAADDAINTSDGMPNLLKYALNLNPLIAVDDPVTGEISTGYLRLSFPRNPNATDITYLIEVTSALMGPWTTNDVVIDQNTPTILQGHDSVPVPSAASRFIRLHVTRP